MGQTIGSQLLGQWYDVAGWGLISAVFFYLSVATDRMPAQTRERIPAFLLNKSTCITLAICMAGMGIYKATTHSSSTAVIATPVALPEWKQIYLSNEGEKLFIDEKSIIRNGATVEYSEQILWPRPKTFPNLGEVVSAKSHLLINCTERTRILLNFLVTRSDGSTVFQNKSGEPPKLPISTDPSKPDFISSNYLCK